MREPALVTVAGVAVQDAFGHDAVDDALGLEQLFPAATAFFTFLIAVRTSVRSFMLWARRPMAWWARLRADLMFAMNGYALGSTFEGREF
jgi:hypothetical protein